LTRQKIASEFADGILTARAIPVLRFIARVHMSHRRRWKFSRPLACHIVSRFDTLVSINDEGACGFRDRTTAVTPEGQVVIGIDSCLRRNDEQEVGACRRQEQP
jgi:hypothetical protein